MKTARIIGKKEESIWVAAKTKKEAIRLMENTNKNYIFHGEDDFHPFFDRLSKDELEMLIYHFSKNGVNAGKVII